MDIALQILGALVVGTLVGLTQASTVESEYVRSRSGVSKVVQALYGQEFSFWRVFYGIPVLLAIVVPSCAYLMWAQQSERVLFPVPTLIALYAMGGFAGYYLRKKMVLRYVSRSI